MAADKIIRNSKLDTFLSKLATKLTSIFWRKAETAQMTIDSAPTASSPNLVTSGGVKTYVDNAIPSVPTISTDVAADKANNNKTTGSKAVYDFVKPATQSSQPAGGLLPGILYKLGTLSGSVSITLASPSDSNVANEYAFTFTADSTAPTITWPSGVEWAGNCLDANGAPEITGGNSYEVSILDSKGIIVEWEAAS